MIQNINILLCQPIARVYGWEKVWVVEHSILDQYIDTEDLINHNFSEWKSHRDDNEGAFENIVNSVNKITGAQRYTYSQNGSSYILMKNGMN